MCLKCSPKQLGNGFEEQYIGKHEPDLSHEQTDERLQEKQNDLIEKNTRITIILGVLAVLAQVADTIVNIIMTWLRSSPK